MVWGCKAEAYIAYPREPLALDLPRVGDAAKGAGFKLVRTMGVKLVFTKTVEISLYASGKMLIKTTNEPLAYQRMKELIECIDDTTPEFRAM